MRLLYKIKSGFSWKFSAAAGRQWLWKVESSVDGSSNNNSVPRVITNYFPANLDKAATPKHKLQLKDQWSRIPHFDLHGRQSKTRPNGGCTPHIILHQIPKFHKDNPKHLGGVWEQTDTQTDTQRSLRYYNIDCNNSVIQYDFKFKYNLNQYRNIALLQ